MEIIVSRLLKENNCLSLKDSRLYSCRVTSNIHILNEYFEKNFEINESDFLDIFKIKDKKEILEFIKNKHEFCKYCILIQK